MAINQPDDYSDLLGSADDLAALKDSGKKETETLAAAAAAWESSRLLGEAIEVDPDVMDLIGSEKTDTIDFQ